MSLPKAADASVRADNTGQGNQALHQGGGNQNLAIGERSTQHNSYVTYNVTLRSRSALEKLFGHVEAGFRGQKRERIIEWLETQTNLSFLDYHQMLLRRLVSGTGEWVLECLEFQQWISTDRSLRNLWMYGILGSGKTMLVASIVQFLELRFNKDSTSACIYLYFQDSTENQPTLHCILINLIKQLLNIRKSGEVSEKLWARYTSWCHTKIFPQLSDYEMLLKEEVLKFEGVYLVIDALDNYHDHQSRNQMLAILQSMPENFKTLITSRTGSLAVQPLGSQRELEVVPHKTDMSKYVMSRIQCHQILRRELSVEHSFILAQKVVDGVTDASNGMFLLVKLHMDYLEQQETVGGIRSALKELPESENTAFDASVKKLELSTQLLKAPTERSLTEHVLTWIIHAKRPLPAIEMRHSFAIQHSKSRLNTEYIPPEVDWTLKCAGFVIMDPKTETLRLVHESAAKYLLEKGIVPSRVDIEMARECLKYLLFEASKSIKHEERGPFFKYASCHWAAHYQSALQHKEKEGERIKLQALVLKFLKSRDRVEHSFQVLNTSSGTTFAGMTGLHAAVYFNLPNLVQILLEKGIEDVNTQGPYQQTALHWAVQYSRPEIVKMLLEWGAGPNIQDRGKDTPLHVAIMWAMENNDNVVKDLLKSQARMDIRGFRGVSALFWAIRYGPLPIATLLIEHCPNVDEENTEGFTPLRQAMTHCISHSLEKTIIDLLLSRGAKLNQPTINGWTPLSHAVKYSPQKIIRRLLRRNPNPADVNLVEPQSKQSPLELAFFHRVLQKAYLLIDHGADVNKTFLDGSSPLIEAVKRQDKELVWKLLQKKADCDAKDPHDKTALHHAVELKDRSITWLLITHNASTTPRDKLGCNVLDWAVEKNDSEVVWLLCQNGAQVNDANEKGITVLHRACGLGLVDIVRFLIVAKDITKDIQDEKGMTPLHHAVLKGHREVVEILASNGFNLNATDSDGATAIHHAVWSRKLNIISILAEKGASLEMFDNHGRTPLMLASMLGKARGAQHVIKRLWKLGADVQRQNQKGLRALDFANTEERADARRLLESFTKLEPERR